MHAAVSQVSRAKQGRKPRLRQCSTSTEAANGQMTTGKTGRPRRQRQAPGASTVPAIASQAARNLVLLRRWVGSTGTLWRHTAPRPSTPSHTGTLLGAGQVWGHPGRRFSALTAPERTHARAQLARSAERPPSRKLAAGFMYCARHPTHENAGGGTGMWHRERPLGENSDLK